MYLSNYYLTSGRFVILFVKSISDQLALFQTHHDTQTTDAIIKRPRCPVRHFTGSFSKIHQNQATPLAFVIAKWLWAFRSGRSVEIGRSNEPVAFEETASPPLPPAGCHTHNYIFLCKVNCPLLERRPPFRLAENAPQLHHSFKIADLGLNLKSLVVLQQFD